MAAGGQWARLLALRPVRVALLSFSPRALQALSVPRAPAQFKREYGGRRNWGDGRALVDHGIALLSSRPHSKTELAQKLARLCERQQARSTARIARFETRKGFERGSPELARTREKAAHTFESCRVAVPLALRTLEEEGHIDDFAFASWFVAQRVKHRPKSLVELRAELRGKGVVDECVRSAISSSAYCQVEACRSIVERKWRGSAKRDKLMTYLMRRGFPRDVVLAALAEQEE